MRAPQDRLLPLLIAGALGACSNTAPPPASRPEAPAAVEAEARAEPAAPPTPATPPAAGAASPAMAIPVVPWPAGFAVTRNGTIGGPAAPAAWYEIQARGLGAGEAARRALGVLTGLAGKDALSDIAVAVDGKTAIAQVRGANLSAVVAASSSNGGSTLRVTLEPRG